MEHQKPEYVINDLDPAEKEALERAEKDPNALVTATTLDQKLGLFSTCCMILNRIIGTGIFSTPADILKATGSSGASLLLWAAGAVISWAGLMVYMEFGLSIPRITKNGVTEVVPRSGGEKNYLEYVYKAPKYLTTCIYGVVFIVLGNTSGNAISFAEHALRASGITAKDGQPEWIIKGIAISAVTGACLLHGSWRAGGIWVNNFFATIKCLLLLALIVAGFVFTVINEDKIQNSLNPSISFSSTFSNSTSSNSKDSSGDSTPLTNSIGKMYGFSQALLLIIFAYGGYDNANYILSEIDRPKRTYKLASMISLGLASVLYMLANIVYYLVIDLNDFRGESTQLAANFFKKTVDEGSGTQGAIASFIAFSSFGNIIVVTFVAARVKQEIGKEGVLPYSRIIASDMRTPFSWLREVLFGPPKDSQNENTPIPALFLHWVFSVILIIGSKSGDAYTLLLLFHSYALHVGVGFFLGLGLIYLHWKSGSEWKEKSGFKPLGGWMWAFIFAVANLFLICTAWFKPPPGFETLLLEKTKFYIYPTVTFALVAFGVIYWIGFAKLYPKYYKKVLTVKRIPVVRDGVQIYEAVFFNWQAPDEDELEELSQEPKNDWVHVES